MYYLLMFLMAFFTSVAVAADSVVYKVYFDVPAQDRRAISDPAYRIDKISVKYSMQGKEYHLTDVADNRYQDKIRIEIDFKLPEKNFVDVEVWAIAYNASGKELNRTDKAKARIYNPEMGNAGSILLLFQKITL